MQQFSNAAQKGLAPEDYDASRWEQRVQALETIRRAHDDSDNAQNTVAQFDVAMTISAMRYLADLHLGRVNPQSLNFDIDVPSRRAAFDLPTLLDDQIVDADDVAAEAAKVEPQSPMYRATEEALGNVSATRATGEREPAAALASGGQAGCGEWKLSCAGAACGAAAA